MKNSTLFIATFLFCILNTVNAQRYDKLVLNDSTKLNVVIKSVNPPEIMYADYYIDTQTEGAHHVVAITQVARIEYSNGRVEYSKDWQKTIADKKTVEVMSGFEGLKNYADEKAKENAERQEEAIKKSKESTYEKAFIIKTNLSNDLSGFINVGIERTLGKNFSLEGYLGYAGQGNNNRGTYYYSEGGRTYYVDAKLNSAGLYTMAGLKWYPGLSNRRMDAWMQIDYQNAAPHGWYMSLLFQNVIMGTSCDFTYSNNTIPSYTSKGALFLSASSLNIGYQQSHILKVLSVEAYFGLGMGYRNSSAIGLVSPGGNTYDAIPAQNSLGAIFSWGLTIGVDINAFKKSLKG